MQKSGVVEACQLLQRVGELNEFALLLRVHLAFQPAQLSVKLPKLLVSLLQLRGFLLENVVLLHQVLGHLRQLFDFLLHLP